MGVKPPSFRQGPMLPVRHPTPARPSLPQAQRWPFQSLGEWETRAGLAFREESRRTSDKESKGHGNNSSLSGWAIASLPERTEPGAPPGQPKTNRAAGSSHAPRPEPPGGCSPGRGGCEGAGPQPPTGERRRLCRGRGVREGARSARCEPGLSVRPSKALTKLLSPSSFRRVGTRDPRR